MTDEVDELLRRDDNAATFADLRDRVQRGSVVPFVGAGLSVPFDYPPWSGVLQKHADTVGKRLEVDTLIRGGKFEEAAELVAQTMGGGFDPLLRFEFDSRKLDGATIDGPPQVLASLFAGPVVTTNYDEVLERAFRQTGRAFTQVIRPRDEQSLCAAFSGNHHYLLKIHGHWSESSSRILTLEQYRAHYGGDSAATFDFTRGLPQALHLMFLSRSVLFLGCSLHNDRYLQVLRKLQADGWHVPPHFAVVEEPATDAALIKRRVELLRDTILPVFFPPQRFDLIGPILSRLGAPAVAPPMAVGRGPLPGGAPPTPAARPTRPSPPRAPAPVRSRSRTDPPADEPAAPAAPIASPELLLEDDFESAVGAAAGSAPPEEVLATPIEPPATSFDPPADLVDALRSERCVLFAGGGASLDSGLPPWSELVEDLVDVAETTNAIDTSLAQALRHRLAQGDTYGPVEECRRRMDANALGQFLRLRLDSHGRYSPTHERLACLPFVGALTSNFDNFIERTRQNAHVVVPAQMTALGHEGAARELATPQRFLVAKMHGSSDRPQSLLLGRNDYQQWLAKPGYAAFLLHVFRHYSVFFYGHRVADPSVRALLRRVKDAVGDGGPRHYVFCWRHDEAQRESFRHDFGLHPIYDPRGITPRRALEFLERLHTATRDDD